MKKTYYEILEIDKNASPEIVKKAYTTLAKKYHPDLQEGNLKHDYEEKLKLINEAYDVISNKEKREIYDQELKKIELEEEAKRTASYTTDNRAQQQESPEYDESQYNTQTNSTQQYSNNNEQEKQTAQATQQFYNEYYQNQIRQAQQKAYHDAYVQDLKNRGYKIRYKKTPKDIFKSFISLAITAFILFLLWQLPFVQNFVKDNVLVQTIMNIF